MANNEDTLMREVEEELRRERLEQLWKQYGTYLLLAAVILVIAVGGYQFNKSRQQAAANTAGAAFANAVYLVGEKKLDEARKVFEGLAENGPFGYAALARLKLAGLDVEAGDKAKAISQYEALARSSNADDLLKSFARIQIASLKIGEVDFTEVENRLNDLAGESNPWRANARELIGLAALKAGKLDAARKPLEQILADPTSPSDVRERAQMLMAEIISAELAKVSPAPVPKTEAAPADKSGEPAAQK
ncbi:MAG TPA: tetratricopeptide repeat protein [Hyphomicrobiaceae bacterium]|nr:tetratricopeptide repeat protein [Hyphomicrobiaceae bacterium]